MSDPNRTDITAARVKRLTPIRAIRERCLDCAGGTAAEVRLCPAVECPLHQYRFGRNPARAGLGNGASFRSEGGSPGSTRDLEP